MKATTISKVLLVIVSIVLSGACSGQMTKVQKKNSNNGIYYEFTPTKLKPIGVVLCLMGIGQMTTNYAVLDNIEPSKQFDAGLEVPFIVVVAAGNPNAKPVLWMKNDYNPFIDVCKAYGLPMHVNGLSLGAMCLEELVAAHKGEFNTVGSIAGLVNTFQWPTGSPSERDLALSEFERIPTKFYYGTADTQISSGGGYTSMLAFSQILQKAGADNQWQPYPGRGHDIWPDAYKDYWPWLLSKVSPAITPPNDPASDVFYDGTNLIIRTLSGKTIVVKPASVN